MSQAKSSNRARAPFAAKTVDAYREVFGDGVRVLYAYEGSFETGEKQKDGAPCLSVMAADGKGVDGAEERKKSAGKVKKGAGASSSEAPAFLFGEARMDSRDDR
jgi:hypothetical protein